MGAERVARRVGPSLAEGGLAIAFPGDGDAMTRMVDGFCHFGGAKLGHFRASADGTAGLSDRDIFPLGLR